MKYGLIVIINLIFFFSHGQMNPRLDLDEIRKNVKSKKKAIFYPVLLDRFLRHDSTLTAEDYKHLYYGQCFQKSFNGNSNHRKKEIYNLINKNSLEQANAYCDSMISIYPISLGLINLKIQILEKLNINNISLIRFKNAHNNILNTISKSGDGQSMRTAIVVVMVADEYDYLYSVKDMKELEIQSYQTPYDLMSFKTNAGTSESIYFLPLR